MPAVEASGARTRPKSRALTGPRVRAIATAIATNTTLWMIDASTMKAGSSIEPPADLEEHDEEADRDLRGEKASEERE